MRRSGSWNWKAGADDPEKRCRGCRDHPSGYEDVLEVRTALEELAVKDACDHITDAQLSELKKASSEV